MKLSYKAALLLKHVTSFTGEKEMNEKGEEVWSPRRLNGEESSQRRHFAKAIKSFVEETQKADQELRDSHNGKAKKKREALEAANPKAEDEDSAKYSKRMDVLQNADQELVEGMKKTLEDLETLYRQSAEIELNDKTKAFVKKYFAEYGEKTGYVEGDDEVIDEVSSVL